MGWGVCSVPLPSCSCAFLAVVVMVCESSFGSFGSSCLSTRISLSTATPVATFIYRHLPLLCFSPVRLPLIPSHIHHYTSRLSSPQHGRHLEYGLRGRGRRHGVVVSKSRAVQDRFDVTPLVSFQPLRILPVGVGFATSLYISCQPCVCI
jgi:hypothetical protein